MSSTALGLAIGLVIALNIYAVDQHDKVPLQISLPCPSQTCNFSSLMPFMDSDTVNFLEFLWTTRLRNLDYNETELYFCGENYNVQFDHCNLKRYYVTVGLLVGGLFLLAMYGCLSRLTVLKPKVVKPSAPEAPAYDDKVEEPPKYS